VLKSGEIYLRHILDEMIFIEEHSRRITLDELKNDEILKRSFLRSIEIGEASNNIPASFKEQHPEIRWRDMAGMRDRLIHAYFSVDWDIVWNVITEEIPENRPLIEKLIEDCEINPESES
jgi:uncharacterized protein with HEPN domain